VNVNVNMNSTMDEDVDAQGSVQVHVHVEDHVKVNGWLVSRACLDSPRGLLEGIKDPVL